MQSRRQGPLHPVYWAFHFSDHALIGDSVTTGRGAAGCDCCQPVDALLVCVQAEVPLFLGNLFKIGGVSLGHLQARTRAIG